MSGQSASAEWSTSATRGTSSAAGRAVSKEPGTVAVFLLYCCVDACCIVGVGVRRFGVAAHGGGDIDC